jgi:hypothetical protein
LVPKKGLEPPSFSNSFSLNKMATLIEYTGLASFSIPTASLTASADSTESHDRRTPDPIACCKLWTPSQFSADHLQFQKWKQVGCFDPKTGEGPPKAKGRLEVFKVRIEEEQVFAEI